MAKTVVTVMVTEGMPEFPDGTTYLAWPVFGESLSVSDAQKNLVTRAPSKAEAVQKLLGMIDLDALFQREVKDAAVPGPAGSDVQA